MGKGAPETFINGYRKVELVSYTCVRIIHSRIADAPIAADALARFESQFALNL